MGASRTITFALTTVLLTGCGDVRSQKDPEATPDLVLLGTVTDLEPAPLSNSPKNWVVTVSVEEVLSGQFDGSTFAFRVHSPSRAGLEVGSQYRILAKRIDQGYLVDEHQWNH